MIEQILFISLFVSFWTFLARETDFIYEYLSLLPKKIFSRKILLYMEMYKNAPIEMGDTFFKFLMNQISMEKGNSKFLIFFAHLLSCHICTNTFFSLIFAAAVANPLFLFAPIPAVVFGFFLKFLRNNII